MPRSKSNSKSGDDSREITPQNGKQILIGETASTLSRVYHNILLQKDALGANSIRIQAKNNKTLNTIEENLAKLQKLNGPFKGVRVSQAVRTGSMKKGVNVLLVFATVDQAFAAIKFMAKESFKVQTVIPRRLREVYGIHENGMTLVRAGNEVPIEIAEKDLPEHLQQPPAAATTKDVPKPVSKTNNQGGTKRREPKTKPDRTKDKRDSRGKKNKQESYRDEGKRRTGDQRGFNQDQRGLRMLPHDRSRQTSLMPDPRRSADWGRAEAMRLDPTKRNDRRIPDNRRASDGSSFVRHTPPQHANVWQQQKSLPGFRRDGERSLRNGERPGQRIQDPYRQHHPPQNRFPSRNEYKRKEESFPQRGSPRFSSMRPESTSPNLRSTGSSPNLRSRGSPNPGPRNRGGGRGRGRGSPHLGSKTPDFRGNSSPRGRFQQPQSPGRKPLDRTSSRSPQIRSYGNPNRSPAHKARFPEPRSPGRKGRFSEPGSPLRMPSPNMKPTNTVRTSSFGHKDENRSLREQPDDFRLSGHARTSTFSGNADDHPLRRPSPKMDSVPLPPLHSNIGEQFRKSMSTEARRAPQNKMKKSMSPGQSLRPPPSPQMVIEDHVPSPLLSMKTSPTVPTLSPFPNSHSSPRKAHSSPRKVPPPGFHNAKNVGTVHDGFVLSPNAPVFLPTAWHQRDEKREPQKEEAEELRGPKDPKDTWNYSLIVDKNLRTHSRLKQPAQAQNDLIWKGYGKGNHSDSRYAEPYRPPRIYPKLFPSEKRRFHDADLMFGTEPFATMDELLVPDDMAYSYVSSDDDNSSVLDELEKDLFKGFAEKGFPGYKSQKPFRHHDRDRQRDPRNHRQPYNGHRSAGRTREPPREKRNPRKPSSSIDKPTFTKLDEHNAYPQQREVPAASKDGQPQPEGEPETTTKTGDGEKQTDESNEINADEKEIILRPNEVRINISKELQQYVEEHLEELIETLCKRKLSVETDHYYIWKYISTSVGVEISWDEAKKLQTPEIIDKAREHVAKVKADIRSGVKLFIRNGAVISETQHEKALKTFIARLETTLKDHPGKDPFRVLHLITPDRRPKLKPASVCPPCLEDTPVKADKGVVALCDKNTDVNLVLYECGYCKQRNFKHEGHWELNCYYYLTGCCPLCGSEFHISPYCPSPPKKLNFHQSIMYIRQLAFYYGPQVLQYYPDIYTSLRETYNDLVVWDPLQKSWVVQPIITNEAVIMWREYDSNDPTALKTAMHAAGAMTRPWPRKKCQAITSGDNSQCKNGELELIDLEEEPELAFLEIDEKTNTVLHPIQKIHQSTATSPSQQQQQSNTTALLPFVDTRNTITPAVQPVGDILHSARSMIPLNPPHIPVPEPAPFPNMPPGERNRLIRQIQAGDVSGSLLYPIIPVPGHTVLLEEPYRGMEEEAEEEVKAQEDNMVETLV